MKILFVTTSLESGGAERVMAILANNLSKIYNVSIFSKSDTTPFFDLYDEVKILYPKKKISYKNRFKSFIGRLMVNSEIYKNIKNEKYDLVIPFSTSTNGVIILLCKILGVPVVASEHNNYKIKLKSFPIKVIKRFIYPMADQITVLTERDIKEFYGKFMANVIVMPNPLAMEPMGSPLTDQRQKVILAVGNVSRWEHKGFDNLLHIFSEIAKKSKDWKLQIAGRGDSSYINNIIIDLDIEDRVELLGEVKNIKGLMQESSIFVLSSRWEGLPMVLIEAMSQGLPSVAFDCFTGPGDIISNKKDGILVDDQDCKKFEEELYNLMCNEKLRDELGGNAITKSKIYLESKIVDQWKNLIEKTVNQN